MSERTPDRLTVVLQCDQCLREVRLPVTLRAHATDQDGATVVTIRATPITHRCQPKETSLVDVKADYESQAHAVLAALDLPARERKAKAEAWDEGRRVGLRQCDWEHGSTPTMPDLSNPYRTKETP